MDEPITITIFLEDLNHDIGDMLCDQSYDEDEYRGLDSNRDTEEEVITAIRFFPENLTRITADGQHPIVCILILRKEDRSEIFSNTKAVFFVHVLAKLAIEYNSFDEDQRGGLLDDVNVHHSSLAYLVQSQDGGDEDYHRNAATVFLEELIRLYHMDLFQERRYSTVRLSGRNFVVRF